MNAQEIHDLYFPLFDKIGEWPLSAEWNNNGNWYDRQFDRILDWDLARDACRSAVLEWLLKTKGSVEIARSVSGEHIAKSAPWSQISEASHGPSFDHALVAAAMKVAESRP